MSPYIGTFPPALFLKVFVEPSTAAKLGVGWATGNKVACYRLPDWVIWARILYVVMEI